MVWLCGVMTDAEIVVTVLCGGMVVMAVVWWDDRWRGCNGCCVEG